MRISWTKTFSSRQKASLILILVGLICFGIIFSFKGYQEFKKKTLSFSQLPELKAEVAEELFPSQVLIPSLGIDLPVFPAEATGSKWEISEEGASYLLKSGIPGKPGNTVIYGHNKRNILGPVLWIKKGAEIKLKNKDGENFTYEVMETKIVSPEQVKVLAPTEETILTLYTCTGFLDSQRFVVVAKLQPEQK